MGGNDLNKTTGGCASRHEIGRLLSIGDSLTRHALETACLTVLVLAIGFVVHAGETRLR